MTNREKFEKFHQNNPKIWEYFCKFSNEAIDNGHRRISHWLIMNRVRWETSIVTDDKDYKISNNHIAYYARLWQETFPDRAHLFNTKRMQDEHTKDTQENATHVSQAFESFCQEKI